MKRLLIWLLALTTIVITLRAEPLVVAFDRFHSARPTAEGGRLLYNELGCDNCHGDDTGLPARSGPILGDVTTRVQADWLKRFLADPSAVRTGTTMPRLLPANDPQAAEAVTHYLASLRKASFSKKINPVVNAARGHEDEKAAGRRRRRGWTQVARRGGWFELHHVSSLG